MTTKRPTKRQLLLQAGETTLERVARCDIMVAELQMLIGLMRGNRGARLPENVETGISAINTHIYKLRTEATRDALMYGLLVDDDDMKKAIAERVLKWYGQRRSSVMQMLDPDGELPSMYMSQTDERLKAEIRHALAGLLGYENIPDDWQADVDKVEADEDEVEPYRD